MSQNQPPSPNSGGNSSPPRTPPPTPTPAPVQFFVARSGTNDGPYSLQQLKAHVASGVVKSGDLVWYEGAAGWMPVNQISGVNVPPSPPATPSAQPMPVATPQAPAQGAPASNQTVEETTIFEVSPSILPDIILGCVTFGLWFFMLPWRYLNVLSCKYRLTTERLIVTAGVIGKQSQELEIYRVRDITVELPLITRMLGLGTVVVHASDSSSPRVELVAVPDAERVKEQIRQAARAAKKSEGVRSVEYMPPS